MLLFDFQIQHRGGQNTSPELRAIMYMMYSRSWYKDNNIVNDYKDALSASKDKKYKLKQDRFLKQNTNRARFALPDNFSC